MSSSQVSGSSWTFHKFISIVLRAATNTVVNSGIAFNRIGGKGHGANDVNNFILTEAEDADDDGIVADDEGEEEGNGEVEMKEFIDDAVVEMMLLCIARLMQVRILFVKRYLLHPYSTT